MNVLSLFDGMSCGQIALNRASIKYDNYFASEIDKYAIKVTMANYPKTIQLGDINKWHEWAIDWSRVDLILAGSPCQGFSFAGKQLAFDDPRSKLFFVFLDILNHVKAANPKVKFLLENVVMKKEYQEIITEKIGVEPVLINSALVSAQNRERLHWTNIPNIEQPEDKGLLLKDIIEKGIVDREKSYCIDANYSKGGNLEQYFPKSRRQLVFSQNLELKPFRESALCHHVANATDIKGNESIKRIYAESGKAPTLTTMGGGHREPKVLSENVGWRKLTPLECERLQTVPDNYTQKALNICFQKCYNCGSENDIKEPTVCKFVESKNVISPSQVGKLNSAISTILDLSEMEQQSLVESLSIKVKTVFLKDAEERDKRLQVTASNVIRHGLETAEKLILPVRFAVKRSVTQGGAVYVCDMQPLRRDTEMQTELIKMLCENFSRMEIKEEDITNQKTVAGFIMSLQSKCLAENSEKEKLFTTLIWTNLIIAKAIFMCAKATQPICLCIDSLSKLQGSLLEMELLALKTESITETSNSARYKMLGNGWTVDIIAHIFKGLKTAST